jgi:hypothetical protein
MNGAPARANRTALAPRDLPGRPLAGPFPSSRALCKIPARGAGPPNNGRFAFRAFLSAKSSDSSAGCYAGHEAVALVGFASPGLTRVLRWSALLSRPPLTDFDDRSRGEPRGSRRSLRGHPRARLGDPLATIAGPHEVSHLVIRLTARLLVRPWLPPMVPCGPFEPPVHPLPLEPRGFVAVPLVGPSSGRSGQPGLRPMRPCVSVTDPTRSVRYPLSRCPGSSVSQKVRPAFGALLRLRRRMIDFLSPTPAA